MAWWWLQWCLWFGGGGAPRGRVERESERTSERKKARGRERDRERIYGGGYSQEKSGKETRVRMS